MDRAVFIIVDCRRGLARTSTDRLLDRDKRRKQPPGGATLPGISAVTVLSSGRSKHASAAKADC
jgi:hypothetical protein